MRVGTDLNPYSANKTPDWSRVTGVFSNGGFIPDNWSNIPYTVGGDGIQPVNGQSYLSFQPSGVWQARAAVGPWETVNIFGNLVAWYNDASKLLIVIPFAPVQP